MATPKRQLPSQPAGYLSYTQSPGLYSRLERAVEQLPGEVKVEGLEGRLRKYPEGISGWELKPFMDAIGGAGLLGPEAGRPTVSRQFLSDLVRQTSPAFTHREGLLAEGGSMPFPGRPEDVWDAAGKLGSPTDVGSPQYSNNTEDGGENYRVYLLMQPHRPLSTKATPFGSAQMWAGGHWVSHPNTIAHMRTKDVGDAVRLQELQSDIRNLNVQRRADLKADYKELYDPKAYPDLWPQSQVPLYDHYPDVLLKGLLLRAAQEGKRAIEIPPFDAISSYVSMRPAGIQQIYGGQVPGTLIKAARPLGGLIDAEPFARGPAADPRLHKSLHAERAITQASEDMEDAADRIRSLAGLPSGYKIDRTMVYGAGQRLGAAQDLLDYLAHNRQLVNNILASRGRSVNYVGPEIRQQLTAQMPGIMRQVELWNEARNRIAAGSRLLADRQFEPDGGFFGAESFAAPSRRLEIPDSVRKRIIEQGIGLGVMAPLSVPSEEQE